MVEIENYEKYLEEMDKEVKMIPLTFDPVLKGVFQRNLELLKEFLNVTLHLNLDTRNCKINIVSNELPKESHKEYRKTVDIRVILNEKIHIDIEMNKSAYEKVRLRNYLYGTKLHSMILEEGDNPSKLSDMYFYQLNLNTEDKSLPYGEDIIVPYGLCTKTVYAMNYYTVLKYLEFYRKLYYTKHESLSEEEIWLASLTSTTFTELNEMLSHILPKEKIRKFIGDVIRMSKDTFNIHEWEKEKCDELVRAESRRVDYKEGFDNGFSNGFSNGFDDGFSNGFDDGFSNGQQKGIDLGREEMLHQNIMAMLEQGADLDFVSKVTGKTIDEINEISGDMEI